MVCAGENRLLRGGRARETLCSAWGAPSGADEPNDIGHS
jgi:hypothetical protein